ERVGVVVVEGQSLLEPQIVPIAIVAIVIQHGHARIVQRIHDLPDDRRLARPRAACDTYDEWVHAIILVPAAVQTGDQEMRRSEVRFSWSPDLPKGDKRTLPFYSALSAIIGSMAAARRAGR